MIVDFIWVTNYKSIQERNKLQVDPSVTAVIGKNESGKSNLIDILGSVSLIQGLSDDTYKKTPQSMDDAKMSIEIECSLTKNEIESLELNSRDKKSSFYISKEYAPFKIAISGGIKEYFNETEFQSNLEVLGRVLEEYKNEVKNSTTQKNLQIYFDYLKGATNYVVSNYSSHLNKIKNALIGLLPNDEKDTFQKTFDFLKAYFANAYNLLPKFYKYDENPLLSQYTINKEFLEKDSSQLQSLNKLLMASGCNIDDIKTACINNPNDGRGMEAKEKIKNGIKTKIEENFNNFYKQEEHVRIIVDISRNRLSLYIQTGGPILSVSERSQGLKWYLNLYVDILANNLEGKNVVFLIDEPGVYLHVDAQKKVLELFDDLTKDNNQVVYTTHSPFMLNENRIDRIRTIQKDTNGNSEIITSVISEKIVDASKSESLSPLVSSLGMKLYQNLGMSEYNMNVITEGHSDAIFLDAMSKKLGIEGMKFIPSIGASKSVYLTSILWGWGLRFKVLFDSDKAGRDGRKAVLKAYAFEVDTPAAKEFEKRNIVMIADVLSTVDTDADYEIESLIDDEDYKKINPNYSAEVIQKDERLKKLFSNLFADAVTKEEISLSENTFSNFTRLFEKLIE